jgi:hypothetical protein
MPPRGAAAALAGGDPFAALPHALALAIFSRLTVEQRLRCSEVCRGWRATLNDHAAWLQLDLMRVDGSACSEALLRAATSRAGGQLRSLRLTCSLRVKAALCAVAAGNAATLQEMRVSAPAATYPPCNLQDLEALLHAAPQLRTLETDVFCGDAAEAHRVLRNEPPFGPLRVLQVYVGSSIPQAAADEVLALAADLAAHASLASVWLFSVPLDAPAALDAVVDAALARRLSCVKLERCQLSPASAPALTRLLGGDTLTELYIDNLDGLLLDAPAAVLLANALHANTSLTALSLQSLLVWYDAAAAAELIYALTAHPRLRLLDLSRDYGGYYGDFGVAAVGTMLAALLLANAPALQTLDIRRNYLGDEGMRPVVEALRHNTHLTKLHCSYNGISDAFARDRLLPAVRANSSLRELDALGVDDDDGSRHAAEALVAARRVRLQPV